MADIKKNVTIWINGQQVTKTIAGIQKEMQKVKNELRNCTIGTEEYEKKAKRLRQLKGVLDEHQRDLKGVERGWRDIVHTLGDVGNIMSGIRSFGYILSGFANSIVQTTQEMTKMDDAMGRVMKTTGLGHTVVEELNESFKKMDTRTSREQLNQLAFEAGKLGINTKEAVLQFVKAADVINVALGDVLGNDAMITIAKLTDVYKSVTNQLDGLDLENRMLRIGDAVNELGKRSTAQEQYIVDFTTRLAGVAGQAGLSADAIMGYASALSQGMQRVEMSATAFQKLIVQIFRKPEQFAKMAGKSVQEFSQIVKTDMNEALTLILSKMKSNEGLEALVPFLDDVKLAGQRATTVFAYLANNMDKVAEAQAIANEQLNVGGSMYQEFLKMNNTAQAQMDKAKKKVVDFRTELGEELLPTAISLVNVGGKGINVLTSLIRFVKVYWVALVPFLAYYTALIAKAGALFAIEAGRKAIGNVLTIQTHLHAQAIYKKTAARALERAEEYKGIAAEAKNQAVVQRGIAQEALYTQVIAGEITMEEALAIANRAAAKERVLEQLATDNLARAEVQETIAKNANTKATVSNTAARAASKGVIGIVLAAVSLLAIGIIKLSRTINEGKRALAEWNKEVQDAAMPDVTKYMMLKNRWEETNGAIDKQTKFLRENRLALDSVKKGIDDVNKASEFFSSKGTDAYIKAVIARVESEKYAQMIANKRMELAKIQEQRDAEELRNGNAERTTKDIVRAGTGTVTTIETYTKYGKLNAEAGRLASEIVNLEERMKGAVNHTDSYFGINTGGLDYLPDDDTSYTPGGKDNKKKNPWESVTERVTDYVDKANTKVKVGLEETISSVTDEYNRLIREIDKIYKETGDETKKDELTDKLGEGFKTMKEAKIDEYLQKVNKEAEKLAAKMKPEEANKYLEKVERAQLEVKEKTEDADETIKILKASMGVEGVTEEQKAQFKTIIEQWEAYKKYLEENIINGVLNDISVVMPDAVVPYRKQGGIKEIRDAYETRRSNAISDTEAKLKDLNAKREAFVEAGDTERVKEVDAAIQQLNDNLKVTNDNLDKMEAKEVFDKWIDEIRTFSDAILDIFSSLNTLLNNLGERQLKEDEKRRDRDLENLEERYKNGVITQEKYEQQKESINNTYDQKKKALELEQWRREKALNISQASMDGILAVMKTFAEFGWPAGAAMAALQTAASAVQIGALMAEPAPYARGGYANEKTYMVGESGPEWVASNRLLQDKSTAPIIAALEDYQRGNGNALRSLGMSQPAWGDVSMAGAEMGVRRSGGNVSSTEALNEILYLLKHGGVSAVISRREMERFEKNENFLRNAARF